MSDPLDRPSEAAAGFSTRAIRAASRTPAVGQRPTAVPIFQTATFSSEDAAGLADAVADGWAGYSYSRISNPTVRALGDAYAELAGGAAGYALASGMAAVHASLASLLRAGDHVVASTSLYGSTRSQLTGTFARFGVSTTFVDPTDPAAVDAALGQPASRVLYAETSANPTTLLTDHARLAELAHRHGAVYVVDNTFASIYVCRPLELGADLVLESATKYLGGHSDVIAGVIAGRRELVERAAAVQVETGATLGPFDAFLVLRGLLTLAVRMDRHAASALALATWLEGRPGVRRVLYPGLASHPQREVAMRQFRSANGGGMLAFELAGGRAAGQAFIDALRQTELTASLGSVHTMVVHPPSTSQRQLTEAELVAAGISPGLLRVSVGLEDVADLIADFDQALAASATATVVGARA
jgi:cystathionine beta-lyase/cystathionine gamma-synthase